MTVAGEILETIRREALLFNMSKWEEKEYPLYGMLEELEPGKPEDGTRGFIAYNVPGKDRMKLKTGRFLTRKLSLNSDFLPDHAIQKIAENINLNLFDDTLFVELVHGEKITQAYEEEIGTESCMTSSPSCTLLYEMNPNKFQMLIMREFNNSARAIVHSLDSGEFYMDRVYSDSEALKDKMLEYAIGRGWFYRLNNGSGFPGASCSTDLLSVSGLIYEDGHIPYMDSLIWGSISGGRLNINAQFGEYELLATDGSLEPGFACESCGAHVSEDDSFHAGDYVYCESCFCKYFICCERCGEAAQAEDSVRLEDTGAYYCEYCANSHSWKCEDCGNHYSLYAHSYMVEGGVTVCESCLDSYADCDDCGEYFSSEMFSIDGGCKYVCENCVEGYFLCVVCGEHFGRENLRDGRCEACEDCEGQMIMTYNESEDATI